MGVTTYLRTGLGGRRATVLNRSGPLVCIRTSRQWDRTVPLVGWVHESRLYYSRAQRPDEEERGADPGLFGASYTSEPLRSNGAARRSRWGRW